MTARISRRALVRLGVAGGVALTAGCGSLFPQGGANNSAQGSAGSVRRSAAKLPEPFTTPLPTPPVLEPASTDTTADYYELTQRVGTVDILPDGPTEIWGYDGTFPGPTIESRSGRLTVVRHRNELPTPTVVHLHGGVTPPEHDGYPTDLVLPADGWTGETDRNAGEIVNAERTYEYPLDQRAAQLWYHDHRMDFTGPQVYNGLAGMHIVRDDEEDSLGLPRGDNEIPLMITDRSFAADGAFDYPALDASLAGVPGVEPDFMSGVLGDCILVNGAAWPFLEVSAARYRFRLLNASNARRYRLALDPPVPNGPSFVQVGSDDGLLAEPIGHEQVEIAQAERFDVVVDFSQYPVGQQITLVNELGNGRTGVVMRFVVARRGADDSRVPSRLSEIRPLTRDDATVEREFVFARGGAEHNDVTLWTVNGEPFDPDRIDANPQLGSVELWKIRTLNVAHPIHVHLAHFQVLSVGGNGADPGPYNAGWKDTVNLGSGGQAEILLKFDGFRGKYVFHCHNLEHEDMMMMANLEVG